MFTRSAFRAFLIRLAAVVVGLSLGVFLYQCGNSRSSFDGGRAWEFLTMQTDLGPRYPESPGWQAFQDKMKAFLDSLGAVYQRQEFVYADSLSGDSVPMANWIIRFNPDSAGKILIGAHCDTRPRADKEPDSTRRGEPILGANDGASGVAVIMLLAEMLKKHPPAVGVDLVLFDGEDFWQRGRMDQYFLGSTYFAANTPDTYWYGVVIDMIGDRDLQIYRESLSEEYIKEINDLVWAAARRLELPHVYDSVGHRVGDDHVALANNGIPAVVVIDFDYPYWHTLADAPDKCSPESLALVGRWMLELIYTASNPWPDSVGQSE